MLGSLLLPRLTGCPCGCATRDECITRTPLPIADLSPCDGRCHNYGLPDLERLARDLGACPCTLGRNPE